MKLIIAFLAMFIGGIIYLLWRPDNLLMFEWIEFWNLADFIYSLRSITQNYDLPYYVKFSLPHALWYLSGILIFAVIWNKQRPMQYFWFLLMTLMCFGGEFGQLLNIVPGNFNLIDILWSVIAGIIALIINHKLEMNNEQQI